MATVFTNQPSGATILYDCALAGSLCSPQNGTIFENVYDTESYATLLRPDGTTGLVFDSNLAAFSRNGNGQWAWYLPRPREVYFAIQWQTNAEFQGIANNGNKLWFIKGQSFSGDNSFVSWKGLPYQSRQVVWSYQGIYGNAHVNGWVGDASGLSGHFAPNVGPSGLISAGSGWHFIECYLKASTSGTSRDGVARWWIDRALVGNYSNLNLTPGGFEEVQINHTWDNSAIFAPPYRDWQYAWHHYQCDMRISAGGTVGSGGSNPGGGTTPPPPPPPQVVLQDLTPANATVTVAGTRQFTISMSAPMATSTSLFITSSNTAIATVPASVNISAGSSTAVFSATGVAAGSTTISTNYNGVTKGATLQVAASGTTGATTTYTYASQFSGTQGSNGWYYLEESGAQMTYNGGSAVWSGSDAYGVQTIWGSGFHPGRFAASVLRFVVPLAGTATITGAYYDLDTGGGAGVVARVNYNGLTLFTRTIANGDSTGGAYSLTQAVAVGDHLEFVVSNRTADYTYNSTNLDPVIAIAATSTVPNPPPPPDPPASVVDLFTAETTIMKDAPFTMTVRLSKIVTVDTTVEIRVGSTSLVTVATSVTVASGSNEKSFTVTPIQVGNVAIDAILTNTVRFNASIQPNPADTPPVTDPTIPPITPENPLNVQRLTISPDGATVELTREAKALAFKYDAAADWIVIAAFLPGGFNLNHRFTWPSGTTTICYRAQDGSGTWGPSACAPFVPPAPPPPAPPVNKAVIDKAGIKWQLSGKTSPYLLKRNGSAVDHTYGVTLRRTGDGYMEVLQPNGVWLRRNGNAWEFVA